MRTGFSIGGGVEVKVAVKGKETCLRGVLVEMEEQDGELSGTVVAKVVEGVAPTLKVTAGGTEHQLVAIKGALANCKRVDVVKNLPPLAEVMQAYYAKKSELPVDTYLTASEQSEDSRSLRRENLELRRKLKTLQSSAKESGQVRFETGQSSSSTARRALDDAQDESEDDEETGSDEDDQLLKLTKAAARVWNVSDSSVTTRSDGNKKVRDADINQLIMPETLKTLKEMRGSRKKRNDSEDDSENEDTTSSRTRGIRRAMVDFRKRRERVQKTPKRVYREWLEDVAEELGVKLGQPVNIRDFPKINFGQLTHMKRVYEMLLGIVDEADSGDMHRVKAQIAMSCRCIHQVAIDQGSWKQAWPLVGLHDRCKKKSHGARLEDMEITNEYLKVEEDIEKRMQANRRDDKGDEKP